MNFDIPQFENATVLVVGDIMLDRYWFGDANRISPEAPVPIVKIKQTDERPGGAANVALNIASLGAKVSLLGLVGADAAGNTLKQQLLDSNVDPKLHVLPNIQTITKLRVISRHQQLLRLDFEENFPAFDTTELLASYQEHLKKADVVILSDYLKGTLADPQIFINPARALNKIVLVDPKGSDFARYRGATIITPNFKEFETVVGKCHSEEEIVRKAQSFLRETQIETMLLTRGEKGMTLIHFEGEEEHLPAHAREVFDVTGAGDTVIALLGASLAAGKPLSAAMAIANLSASLVVAKLGAATISTPELQGALIGTATLTGGVLNEEQLLIAANTARAQHKKVVFTNGCFDILHAGHVKYLQQAKQLGDFLIVAVNDDDSVRRLKGSSRPINSVEQRMAVLASLGVVDWVIPFADDTPKRILKLLQPHTLVKGGDYTIEDVVGFEIVQAYGGDVRVLGIEKGVSTTNIINRAVANSQSTLHSEG